MVNPRGAPGVLPKGPDSFVLTNFTKHSHTGRWCPPTGLREILDPPLLGNQFINLKQKVASWGPELYALMHNFYDQMYAP